MKRYIVIGAGILGASTAYHLTKLGAKVTIVDRKEEGQATSAAAGIVCPWLTQRRNKAWYFLAKNGARYYSELISKLEEEGENETGYKIVGAISLHTDEKKLDQMEARAHQRIEDAPEIGRISRLSATEARNLFPPLADEFGAIHISGAARVNGSALLHAIIRAARKNGAEFIQGDATILHNGRECNGITVEEKKIYADQIIVTAGAWASSLFKPLGLHFLVKPQKAQIIHLQLPSTETGLWPVVMPPNNQYILAGEAGRIIIGATHEDNVGFDMRVTAGGVQEILHKALMVAPGLEHSTLLETKVGFRPVAPGFLPLIGSIPGYQNILIANGLGASGLTVGPYLGAQLALLAQGKKMEINLSDYDVTNAFDTDQVHNL